VKKWQAPSTLWNDGIREFYEGVIISDVTFGARYWVAFTELPSSIKVGDNLDYPVDCYGYFFKRSYLENKDGKRVVAPLIVARTVALQAGPAPLPADSSLLTGTPIGVVLTTLSVLGVLIAVMILLLRRSDSAVKTRLREARTVQWVEPTEDGTEPPAPAETRQEAEQPPKG
jgi:hypothetical protein